MHINPIAAGETANGAGNRTYLGFNRNVYACCTTSTTVTISNAAGDVQHSFLMYSSSPRAELSDGFCERLSECQSHQ